MSRGWNAAHGRLRWQSRGCKPELSCETDNLTFCSATSKRWGSGQRLPLGSGPLQTGRTSSPPPAPLPAPVLPPLLLLHLPVAVPNLWAGTVLQVVPNTRVVGVPGKRTGFLDILFTMEAQVHFTVEKTARSNIPHGSGPTGTSNFRSLPWIKIPSVSKRKLMTRFANNDASKLVLSELDFLK